MKKEKIFNILLFVLIFSSILSTIILKPIADLDELWNYNFARNIANGLVPYKDFNMVITPFLSIICGIILKITFNELIIMRILAALLCTLIIYKTYKLFILLNIKKEIAIIFIGFIGYLFIDIFCLDYNFASLLIVLIIIAKEIKLYQKDSIFIKEDLKEDILLGILAGVSLLIKQTSGLLICIALLGNKLLFVRNKEEIKKSFKNIGYRLIGITIPILVFIAYLVINNAFYDFFSYTILGVAEFNNTIPYKHLINFNLLGILSILVPITFIYLWIKTIIYERNKILYIFLVYGLAIFIICFPISNDIHFLIGGLPIIIAILYELYNVIKNINISVPLKKVNKFLLIFTNYLIIFLLIYISMINLYKYYKNSDDYSKLEHYKYIIIDKNLERQIEKVDKYILKKENVIILDSSAALYMIPIEKYNKDYDMFNKGNFGFKGEQRLINQIKESNNVKYLILNDRFDRNWQTPLNVIDYVKENKTKTGQIEIFDIYE